MNKIEFPRFIIGAMRLGAWGANMTTKELEVFVNGCIDLGFNAFDHADIYGDYTTEFEFGKVLKLNPNLRSNINLITKCGIRKMCDNRPTYSINSYDSSRAHIIESVENSLSNFNTDYIDTLLIHRPDYLMEPDEVASAFKKLEESGKVLQFGVSNFTEPQFDLLNKSYPLVTNQIEISLFNNAPLDNGILNHSLYNGILPMAWSPLGGGDIFVANNPITKRLKKVVTKLKEYYNCELDELLYAWILKHPAGILPVTGTSKLHRIKSAKNSLAIDLEKEHWYMLLEAAKGESVP